MRLSRNIKTKLTLWYLLVVMVLLLVWSIVAYSLLSRELLQKNLSPLNIRVTELVNESGTAKITDQTDLIESTGNNDKSLILSMKLDLSELENTPQKNILTLQTQQGFLQVDLPSILFDDNPVNTDVWLYLYSSKSIPNTYTLVASYQPNSQTVLSSFTKVLIISIPLALLVAGILGFFLVRRFLKPVREINEAAHGISDKNLGTRLKDDSKDELGQLAATLNGMFDRLQQAFERERQFTTDVSHELRAPLAVAQGEASLALRKERSPEEYQRALENISRQIDRLSSLINHLLFLARSDNGLILEDVNMSDLLREVAEDAEVLCEQKNITLESELNETALIHGDVTRLREMFLNLVTNAVRYTPEKGKIKISLSVRDGLSFVSVKDSGIGIPKEDLPYIFNSFYRVDKSRSREDGGAGLGLAICKRIAELHGGKISVSSEENVGSTFTMELPIMKKSK